MLPATKAPSQQEARREISRRKLAKQSLVRYGQYMRPELKDFAHQRFLAEKLLEVEKFVESRGKEGIGNLMVMMPPQHGKSTTISHLFPSWELGRHPDWPFILTSYNDLKAKGNSRAVRDLVESNLYRAVFGDLASGIMAPVELSSDSRSVSEWKLALPYTGGVVAAGVGGGITGHPSKITIIDDPFKLREDADSVANQEAVMDWYETSVYTRRQMGSAVILFHTRWNVNDLAGKLIQKMATNPKADQWDVVMLPALALAEEDYPKSVEKQRERMADEGVFIPLADQLGRAPGEALCPTLQSQEMLESVKDNMSSYNWSSMYQQSPTVRSGGMFKRQWFTVAEKLPDDIRFVRSLWYWDKAAKQGSGDYSAGVLMAVDQYGRIWVLSVVRGQWSGFERHANMRKAWQAARERFGERLPVPQLWHQQDPAGAGLDSARDTNKALEGLPAHFEPVSGDKEVRADPWSTSLEGLNVVLLKAGWNNEFIDEHISFPKGKNDDMVDAASSCYTRITLKMKKQGVKSHQG